MPCVAVALDGGGVPCRSSRPMLLCVAHGDGIARRACARPISIQLYPGAVLEAAIIPRLLKSPMLASRQHQAACWDGSPISPHRQMNMADGARNAFRRRSHARCRSPGQAAAARRARC
eukprot:2091110-Pleurochrysis_carterae.AAC.1